MHTRMFARRFNGYALALGSAGNLGFNFGHIKSREGRSVRSNEESAGNLAEFVKGLRIYIANPTIVPYCGPLISMLLMLVV